MKATRQRLVLTVVAEVALVGAGLIAASALREDASYFYTPTTLASANVALGKDIRRGGMTQKGSIAPGGDGESITFTVQDQGRSQKLAYRGITPDLFVESSGVVADGRLGPDRVFVADSLLAKHYENYVPKELVDIDMNKAGQTKDTFVL